MTASAPDPAPSPPAASRPVPPLPLYVHGATVMGMISLQGGPFLTGFLLALGATHVQIGLLTTAAMASQVAQLIGLVLVARLGKRKPLTLTSMALYRASWLVVAATPWVAGLQSPWVALGIVAAGEWLSALSAPAWNSWLKDAVPDEVRGTIMSRRLVLGTLVSLACTALGGLFLDSRKAAGAELEGYGLLFAAGVALGVVGLLAVSRLPDDAPPPAETASLREQLAAPLREKNFRRLLAFTAAWSFACNLAAPFYIVYLVEELGQPMSVVTGLTVAAQVTNLLSLTAWGRLSDTTSNKSVLRLCCPLFLLTIAMLFFTTLPEVHSGTVAVLAVSYLASGVASAGISVGSTNIALKLAPRGQAASYLTAYGLAGAAAGAVAPLVGGALSATSRSLRLSLELSWVTGTGAGRVAPLAFKGLEFVFLAATLVGLYAMHRLSLVQESGEIDEREFRARVLAEMSSTLRGFSPLPGMRQLASVPLVAVARIQRRILRRREPRDD